VIKTSIKTYGVKECCYRGKTRYFIVCDGRTESMHYAEKDFAMKKAYTFCKECYSDFTRHDGIEIKFEFKYV
jgi:hypothetical protein